MITKTISVENIHTIQVTFSLPATLWADTIELVGDFNEGISTTTPMHQGEDGWQTTLELPTQHTYQYSFLLDGGELMSDWNGDGFQTDIHGESVSIVMT
jgi:1,4-alpha-glucan branching enzyme